MGGAGILPASVDGISGGILPVGVGGNICRSADGFGGHVSCGGSLPEGVGGTKTEGLPERVGSTGQCAGASAATGAAAGLGAGSGVGAGAAAVAGSAGGAFMKC